MITQGQRLARVQLSGHVQIDRVFTPLSREIADAVMARATPDARGIPRLSLPARAAILGDVGRLIDAARTALLIAILEAIKAAREAAMVGVEPLPRDIVQEFTAAGETWRTLGTDRSSVISQTGALLIGGIAAGQPAREVAAVCRQYFSPWFSTYRSETGALVHRGRKGAIRAWPGRAGQASQHARGVMLWQTTAAHGRTMVRRAIRDDELLRFHVSHKHLEVDRCDLLERQDIGYGAGIYPADQFPGVPQHFKCRCWAEPASRLRFLTQSESVPA